MAKKVFTEEEARERKNARQREYSKKTGYAAQEKYKKEITEIVSKLQFDNLPNKYQVAFNIAKAIEQKVAENLNNSQFVDAYLKSNTGVKNDIITEYLSTLNNISLAPTVVAENPSTIHFSNLNSNPKTLKEAGEIFSKMLK